MFVFNYELSHIYLVRPVKGLASIVEGPHF